MPVLRSEFFFEYYVRTTPVFETGSARDRWPNRILAVGVARRTATGMLTDVLAIM